MIYFLARLGLFHQKNMILSISLLSSIDYRNFNMKKIMFSIIYMWRRVTQPASLAGQKRANWHYYSNVLGITHTDAPQMHSI